MLFCKMRRKGTNFYCNNTTYKHVNTKSLTAFKI